MCEGGGQGKLEYIIQTNTNNNSYLSKLVHGSEFLISVSLFVAVPTRLIPFPFTTLFKLVVDYHI